MACDATVYTHVPMEVSVTSPFHSPDVVNAGSTGNAGHRLHVTLHALPMMPEWQGKLPELSIDRQVSPGDMACVFVNVSKPPMTKPSSSQP